MKKEIAATISKFRNETESLDKKVVIIFISIALLQTISFYFSSARFFRQFFYLDYFDSPYFSFYQYLYWFNGDFITLFVLPCLIIKLVLKEKIQSYGVRAGKYRKGLKWTLLFSAVMVVVVWFASALPSFTSYYPQLSMAKDDWKIFVVFEAVLFIYLFAWEFFWRGFMLFGLEEKFGLYAIFIQMVPFVIMHNGKPLMETLGAIIGGLLLGVLALKTRSFIYCVLVHFCVIFSIDFIAILRYKANNNGIGIISFVEVIRHLF
jgi:membrane protease YdiL (CAAX protease family)